MTNLTDLLTKFMNTNTASTSGSGSLPSNTVANPKSNLKAITTRSGVSYNGTQVPPPPSSLPKVVERETEVTKDTVPPTNNGSTEDVQPPVVHVETNVPISEPVVAPGPFQMGTREESCEGTEGSNQSGSCIDLEFIRICHKMRRIGTHAGIGQRNIILQVHQKILYSSLIFTLMPQRHIGTITREKPFMTTMSFAKLINDMRNIKMTMSKIQLNSKFVNNMLPEWGRFVTPVKLNKGLKDSNFDQLYAYLKQHEAHANENKMMLERLTQQTVDPLALMSNVSPQIFILCHQQNPPSNIINHILLTLTSDLYFLNDTNQELNQHSCLTHPVIQKLPFSNKQSNQKPYRPRNQATVQGRQGVCFCNQGRQNRGQGNNARGAGAVGYGRAQNRVGNANPGQVAG
ncbi:hypothetical protein Tco_0569091 [Tanacetum coccineum]